MSGFAVGCLKGDKPSTLEYVARGTGGRRCVSTQGRKVRAPHESECLLTAGRGDPTESATENKPPLTQVEGKDETVR